MNVQLFNTASHQIEKFNPIHDGVVNFFVCGPTVYDYSHVGHAKTYTQFDFIVKFLRRFYDVHYLVNVTDVDDKIIQRAQVSGVDPVELARKFEKEFFEDMTWLGNDAFTTIARSHDFVPEVISQVERLISVGAAYRLVDGWYFDLSVLDHSMSKLTNRPMLEDASHSRLGSVGKRNSGDFVLWKFSKPGEPSWDSASLGAGRPGWHIEDTAITEAVFGEQYDVHGGASDLMFPHHEAEMIQMETLSGKPLVNYWLHTGLLEVDGRKMGKSEGNFTLIRDFRQLWDPKTLRYFFLSRHYRSTIEMSDALLRESASARERVENFYRSLNVDVQERSGQVQKLEEFRSAFFGALKHDVNTPEALSALFTFIREVNRDTMRWGSGLIAVLEEVNAVFEVFDFTANVDVSSEVEELVGLREKFRAERNFGEADRVRNELKVKHGIVVEDTPDGVTWRVA